jgi:hypothetical protein
MKSILIFLLSLSSVLGYSTEGLDTIPRGEFYPITEAYLFKGDSIYTMKEEYVDIPSKVFFMVTRSSSPDSSVVISIDHGNDKVMFLGFAEEIEAPGNFDFLTGKKTYYYWKYIVHDKKEPGECLVIREYVTKVEDLVPQEYYRFHFLFEEYKFLFYCEIPAVNFLSSQK